jgi:hypothetical protein
MRLARDNVGGRGPLHGKSPHQEAVSTGRRQSRSPVRWPWPCAPHHRSVATGRGPTGCAGAYLHLMATRSDIVSCLQVIRRLEAELDAATKLSEIRIVGGQLRRVSEDLRRMKEASRPASGAKAVAGTSASSSPPRRSRTPTASRCLTTRSASSWWASSGACSRKSRQSRSRLRDRAKPIENNRLSALSGRSDRLEPLQLPTRRLDSNLLSLATDSGR